MNTINYDTIYTTTSITATNGYYYYDDEGVRYYNITPPFFTIDNPITVEVPTIKDEWDDIMKLFKEKL